MAAFYNVVRYAFDLFYVLSRAYLKFYVRHDIAFFQTCIFCYLSISCARHQYFPRSTLLSSSGQGDGDSTLDSRESGAGLTRIDSRIPSPIYVVAYCESDDDRLDVRRFHRKRVHGSCWNCAIVVALGEI